MLTNQTASKLRAMKLPAMALEYLRQMESPGMVSLDFDERLCMMVDSEWLSRENNRIKKLTKDANLRFSDACFADIDYRPSRKLDRQAIARLSDFSWVSEKRNLIITGATGTGKTWLACAFGHEACRMGIRTVFYRVSRLINELALGAGSGSLPKTLARLAKTDILILDDWGLNVINPQESRLLLEVFEDRYNRHSTVIAAQVPVAKWHGLFEDSTLADAILDRLVHSSYRFELQGHSMRSKTGENLEEQSPSADDVVETVENLIH
jgi:DNA replication protein DnaC